MAVLKNILLVILIVHDAVLLSQQETADETSPEDAEVNYQMVLIIRNQQQLWTILQKQDVGIKQMQEGAKGLRARFTCNYKPCRQCTCKHKLRMNYNVKRRIMCTAN